MDLVSVAEFARQLRKAGCASIDLTLPDGVHLVMNLYQENTEQDPHRDPVLRDPFAELGPGPLDLEPGLNDPDEMGM